jgi:hypothetical protein
VQRFRNPATGWTVSSCCSKLEKAAVGPDDSCNCDFKVVLRAADGSLLYADINPKLISSLWRIQPPAPQPECSIPFSSVLCPTPAFIDEGGSNAEDKIHPFQPDDFGQPSAFANRFSKQVPRFCY